jgi:hypothetical protein
LCYRGFSPVSANGTVLGAPPPPGLLRERASKFSVEAAVDAYLALFREPDRSLTSPESADILGPTVGSGRV